MKSGAKVNEKRIRIREGRPKAAHPIVIMVRLGLAMDTKTKKNQDKEPPRNPQDSSGFLGASRKPYGPRHLQNVQDSSKMAKDGPRYLYVQEAPKITPR